MRYLFVIALLAFATSGYCCVDYTQVNCKTSTCGLTYTHPAGDFDEADYVPSSSNIPLVNGFITQNNICAGGTVEFYTKISSPGGYTEKFADYGVGANGQASSSSFSLLIDHEQNAVPPKTPSCASITGGTCIAGSEFFNGTNVAVYFFDLPPPGH